MKNQITFEAVIGDGWYGERLTLPLSPDTTAAAVTSWQEAVLTTATDRVKFAANGARFSQTVFWVVETVIADYWPAPNRTGNGLPKSAWVSLGLIGADKAATLPPEKILGIAVGQRFPTQYSYGLDVELQTVAMKPEAVLPGYKTGVRELPYLAAEATQ